MLPVMLLALAGQVWSGELSSPPAFSGMQPGSDVEGWRVETLRGREATRFALVSEGGSTVLEARATASVAAMAYDLRLDPADSPRLSWRWKIGNLLSSSDLYSKKGDDYPSRVYVTFDVASDELTWAARIKLGLARLVYGAKLPTAALCYVWDRSAAAGTIHANAYTDRVQMIVLRSGADGLGDWQTETRDVAADYLAAFGKNPPAITGVAVAADTDDTGESAIAWFGDLHFEPPVASSSSD
jgi:hypothetical protein